MLIMVPLRLGLDKLNQDYIPILKKTFRIPQSLGIAGGKPRASLYFVGNQGKRAISHHIRSRRSYHSRLIDDYIFYLDPHTVQPAPRFPELGDVPASEDAFDTYHCQAPLRMHMKDIDPSLCLAFYCRDRDDFHDFCARILDVRDSNRVIIKFSSVYVLVQLAEGHLPIFTVAENTPEYLVRPKPPKHSEKLFSDDEDDVVFI